MEGEEGKERERKGEEDGGKERGRDLYVGRSVKDFL